MLSLPTNPVIKTDIYVLYEYTVLYTLFENCLWISLYVTDDAIA